MNMMGSNVLAAITIEAEETLAELAKVTVINGENCGKVKDLVDNAKRLAKSMDESRKMAKAPHAQAAEAVDAAYKPLIDSVDAAARAVNKLVESWVIAEKRRAEAEAAEARRKAEEAAAEADPFLDDAEEAATAQAAAAIAETRAVAARQVTSAAGISKASSLRTVRSAVVTDAKALACFYAEHPDVLAAATKCANAAIRAAKGGPLIIPGVEIKVEEKLV